jgi:hypothetical protein
MNHWHCQIKDDPELPNLAIRIWMETDTVLEVSFEDFEEDLEDCHQA